MGNRCGEPAGTGYAGLVLLAALVSIEMARSLTGEQMVLLGSFFEILGDNLALLAASPTSLCSSPQEKAAAEQ